MEAGDVTVLVAQGSTTYFREIVSFIGMLSIQYASSNFFHRSSAVVHCLVQNARGRKPIASSLAQERSRGEYGHGPTSLNAKRKTKAGVKGLCSSFRGTNTIFGKVHHQIDRCRCIETR